MLYSLYVLEIYQQYSKISNYEKYHCDNLLIIKIFNTEKYIERAIYNFYFKKLIEIERDHKMRDFLTNREKVYHF